MRARRDGLVPGGGSAGLEASLGLHRGGAYRTEGEKGKTMCMGVESNRGQWGAGDEMVRVSQGGRFRVSLAKKKSMN